MSFRHSSGRAIGLYSPLLVLIITMAASVLSANAQQAGLAVNLAPVDGLDLTPDNIFSFRIESTLSSTVTTQVKGTIRYRNSPLEFSYQLSTTVHQGSNKLNPSGLHPSWTFSSTPLRELFLNYKRLPPGTYEYCVTLSPIVGSGEARQDGNLSECLYHQADDLFLINLVDPENGAKIHEYNPVLSWTVNYPFASALTYRLRLAEIRDGQNTVNAVSRNNPVYQEGNLRQTSLVYPIYGKPLEAWQPYAWTVDAYYKDILLGGAEPWKFVIVEDSLMAGIPKSMPYLDLRLESGKSVTYAIGVLKIKYVLEDYKEAEMEMELTEEGSSIALPSNKIKAHYGDNRFDIDFTELPRLKHLHQYKIVFRSIKGEQYQVLFKYVNPDFL